MPLVILLLIGLVLGEIAGFVLVGELVGVAGTLLLVVAAAVAGAVLLRRLGTHMLIEARASVERGEPPVRELRDGAALVTAALLLIIPGFITDLVAIVLLIGPLRRWLAAGLFGRLARSRGLQVRSFDAPGRGPRRPPDTIDAEFEEVDDTEAPPDAPRAPSRWGRPGPAG